MKKYLVLLLALILTLILGLSAIVVVIDPFFIYHKPLKGLYYELDNERIQNPGIVSHFEYDSIITGTSLTENFRTGQFDELFDAESIKIPQSGATFYETAEYVRASVNSGHNLKIVMRSFDINHLMDPSDWIRTDLGQIPKFLNTRNPFKKVYYLLNKEVLLDYCFPVINRKISGHEGGYTTFDDYSSWRGDGLGKAILEGVTKYSKSETYEGLTEDEKQLVIDNVEKNIISLANENPATRFIYYIPPYNTMFWGQNYESGNIRKLIEAEAIALEKMLMCENILVYCYTNELDITTNLDLYTDYIHYCYKVNDYLLDSISQSKDQMTSDNFRDILDKQEEIYMNYDYEF